MDALIIKSDNKSELDLIKKLVKKMGLESRILSAEEMEDIGMGILMSQSDRSNTVPESDIMDILDK